MIALCEMFFKFGPEGHEELYNLQLYAKTLLTLNFLKIIFYILRIHSRYINISLIVKLRKQNHFIALKTFHNK